MIAPALWERGKVKEGGIEGKEMEGEREWRGKRLRLLGRFVIPVTWETEAGGLQVLQLPRKLSDPFLKNDW